MRIIIYLLGFIISPTLSKIDINFADPRTVKLALETALLLEPKDARKHLDVVNGIKALLTKLADLLEPQAELYEQDIRLRNGETVLMNVLKDVGANILNLTKEKVENVGHAVKKHVENHVVSSDPVFKKILNISIDQMPKDGNDIKNIIQIVLSDNTVLTTVTRGLKSLYSRDDIDTLNEFIIMLNRNARLNKDPSDVLIEWLDFSIFNRFSNLRPASKARLLNDIKILTTYLADNFDRRQNNIVKRLDSFPNETDIYKRENKKNHSHILKVSDNDIKPESDASGKIDGRKTGGYNKPGAKETEFIVDNVEFLVNPVSKK